jgi:hypothetical protein
MQRKVTKEKKEKNRKKRGGRIYENIIKSGCAQV